MYNMAETLAVAQITCPIVPHGPPFDAFRHNYKQFCNISQEVFMSGIKHDGNRDAEYGNG